jgi:hypothetical protein
MIERSSALSHASLTSISSTCNCIAMVSSGEVFVTSAFSSVVSKVDAAKVVLVVCAKFTTLDAKKFCGAKAAVMLRRARN